MLITRLKCTAASDRVSFSNACLCVCVYGAGSWWKPRAEAYIRAPALIKGQQAVLLSFWEQHRFLLLLWQQDKVPFQLEKYLATYLPTAILGFYFSCHLIRNSCYFTVCFLIIMFRVLPMLMFTPLVHCNAVNCNNSGFTVFWCLFLYFAFCRCKAAYSYVHRSGFGSASAFCMRGFMLLCVWVDVILLAPVIHFCLTQTCMHTVYT